VQEQPQQMGPPQGGVRFRDVSGDFLSPRQSPRGTSLALERGGELKETLKEAAARHRLKANTLYRRLERLAQAGRVQLNRADFVGPTIYLDAVVWDSVCQQTLPPGRPRKTD